MAHDMGACRLLESSLRDRTAMLKHIKEQPAKQLGSLKLPLGNRGPAFSSRLMSKERFEGHC